MIQTIFSSAQHNSRSRLVKCIYSCEAQQQLICQVIDAVEVLAEEHSKDIDSKDPQNDNAYHPIFHMIESDLLRIAAILKHPSFREEEEWRVVSPVITDYVNAAVLFREGASMLVPYIEFNLAPAGNSTITVEHIFLGPTPNITISMNSMTMYLSKHGIQPREGISYCQIPFRAR